MKTKGSWELVWVAIAMVAVLTSLIVVISRDDLDPRVQSELKSERIALINQMRLALSAASEEQNFAVLSTNEQASKAFLERAVEEITLFKQSRTKLDMLVPKRAVENESTLINRVDETFREFQSVSEQLSTLATQSSNRKAYELAFGPATNLLKAMDKELEELAVEQEGLQDQASKGIVKIISNARISGLRIQVQMLPHIAESNNQKMDEMEKAIAAEDQSIEEGLASLESSLNAGDRIAKIKALYREFKGIESQIISLSRENSGIRSVEIALNEKRKSVFACQDALAELEKAIRAEPIESAVPKGRVP